jgi:hypothetical protein
MFTAVDLVTTMKRKASGPWTTPVRKCGSRREIAYRLPEVWTSLLAKGAKK